jgi:hypothetical protein
MSAPSAEQKSRNGRSAETGNLIIQAPREYLLFFWKIKSKNENFRAIVGLPNIVRRK